jgi:hypothetical protein
MGSPTSQAFPKEYIFESSSSPAHLGKATKKNIAALARIPLML